MPETITVYDWFGEILPEICAVLKINDNQFRNYHRVIGGEYKDGWHLFLDTVIPDNFSNDSIVKLFTFEEDFIISDYTKVEREPWQQDFLRSYKHVMDKLDVNGDGIHVSFSW